MKSLKYLIIIIMVLIACSFLQGERKVKPKTLDELSNPTSPSYVPYPYPKNRQEMIADLKYAFEKTTRSKFSKETTLGKIKLNLLEKKPIYKIGRILKVKMQNDKSAYDYIWLVLIRDQKNEIVARICMHADGLYGSGMATDWAAANCKEDFPDSPRRGPHHLVKETDILNFLTHALERPIGLNDIKTMERIAIFSHLGNHFIPSWEIRLKNGKLYYYSEVRHTVYEVGQRISTKEYERENTLSVRKLVKPSPHNRGNEFHHDSLNGEFLVFKVVKRLKVKY